jgi:hypothetical protein
MERSMQIIISWSGKTSYQVALAMRDLFRAVVPIIDVWVSSDDIEHGSRWSPDLLGMFDQTDYAIICVDPTNHLSPWLQFEIGAMAKSIDMGRMIAFLFQIQPRDINGPLSQFNTITLDQQDIYKMIDAIHMNLPGSALTSWELKKGLDNAWPDFIDKLTALKISLAKETTTSQKETTKDQESADTVEYIDEVDEKILVLLHINTGIDEDKLASRVYLSRGDCLKHLISLEQKKMVWSKMTFGSRSWYITDYGRKYLPGIYQA